MKLIIDYKTMARMPTGKIQGEIFFEEKGFFFPERKWSDNVLIVLSWWLKSLIGAVNNEEDFVDFHFMEGPCYVRFFLKKLNNYDVIFAERRENEVLLKFNSNNKKLICDLYDLAKNAREVCEKNHWVDGDYDELVEAISCYEGAVMRRP